LSEQLLAAIEAGGTKFLCAVATIDGRILAQERIATASPEMTFAAVASFFDQQRIKFGSVAAAGVASFGPLDLDASSPNYGKLTTTPKPGWSGVDILGSVSAIVAAPTELDTDVNLAGLAEARHGAGIGLNTICYVTVGTGIGVGVIDHGKPISGVGHLEAGHMRVGRASGDDFGGVCPYHGDCLEGLASGPAMAARWGQPAETLGSDHVGWTYQAHYLASLCVNLTYLIRPERIILGGGVTAHPQLHRLVREQFTLLTGGYSLDRCSAEPEAYICLPTAEEPSAGLVGAIEIARQLLPAADRD
jgi:fructokinase